MTRKAGTGYLPNPHPRKVGTKAWEVGELIRLARIPLQVNFIAEALGLNPSTVQAYLSKCHRGFVSHPVQTHEPERFGAFKSRGACFYYTEDMNGILWHPTSAGALSLYVRFPLSAGGKSTIPSQGLVKSDALPPEEAERLLLSAQARLKPRLPSLIQKIKGSDVLSLFDPSPIWPAPGRTATDSLVNLILGVMRGCSSSMSSSDIERKVGAWQESHLDRWASETGGKMAGTVSVGSALSRIPLSELPRKKVGHRFFYLPPDRFLPT